MGDKALLIGINEYKTISHLRGCHNDVKRMSRTLIDQFRFPKSSLRVRLDGDAIKSVIEDDMEWLLQGAKSGDRRLMHFSGHGSYTIDEDKEVGERGRDELLCLYNMSWDDPDSYLLDDDIAAFTRRVPKGVQLVLVFDSCHSGTGSRFADIATTRGARKPAPFAQTLIKKTIQRA